MILTIKKIVFIIKMLSVTGILSFCQKQAYNFLSRRRILIMKILITYLNYFSPVNKESSTKQTSNATYIFKYKKKHLKCHQKPLGAQPLVTIIENSLPLNYFFTRSTRKISSNIIGLLIGLVIFQCFSKIFSLNVFENTLKKILKL